MIGTSGVIVVIGALVTGMITMIACRAYNDKKCESDELEPRDVDLTETPQETDGLHRELAKSPGAHRKAKIPTVLHWRKPMGEYQTTHGGYKKARVVIIYDNFAVFENCGTQFVRSIS